MVSGLSPGVMTAKPQTDPLSMTSSEQSIQCGHSSFYLANLLGLLNHVLSLSCTEKMAFQCLREAATGCETTHQVLSVTFQMPLQGVETMKKPLQQLWLCDLKNPSGLWLQCISVIYCMSAIACNSMWGLSPDGSAGSTSNSPLPQETFCDPCKCCTQQHKKTLTLHRVHRAEQKFMTVRKCVCIRDREERGHG